LCDAFLHVENASLHVVSLCGIGLDIGSALLLQLVAECGQILCLLYPAGRQFACLFGAEILQGVVGGEVINNQLKILLHLFAFRFSIFGTGYALLGALHLLIVFPGVLDGYQLCPAAQVFGVKQFFVQCCVLLIRNECVDADLPFGLVAVRGEPSQVVELVDDQHVVVGWRVEGHTYVLRLQILVVFAIVSGDEDVISSQRLFSVSCKIEGHTV